jgi:hypothetical protein
MNSLLLLVIINYSVLIGINIIEVLTALILVRVDPSHIGKSIEKYAVYLLVKNSLYILILIATFTLVVIMNEEITVYYFAFVCILIMTMLLYIMLDPYRVKSVRFKKTRLGRLLYFETYAFKERHIFGFLKHLRVMTVFVSIGIIGMLISQFIQ